MIQALIVTVSLAARPASAPRATPGFGATRLSAPRPPIPTPTLFRSGRASTRKATSPRPRRDRSALVAHAARSAARAEASPLSRAATRFGFAFERSPWAPRGPPLFLL